MDSFIKLEKKIDEMLEQFGRLKNIEKDQEEKSKRTNEKIAILEKENSDLKEKLNQISRQGEEDRRKVEQSAQKVRELLEKLEKF